MAKHTLNIEGSADFSSVIKGVKDLQSTLSGAFGKNGFKVLDEDSIDFLKVQTQSALSQMVKQIQTLRKEAGELDKLMKNSVGDERQQASLQKDRLAYTSRILQAETALNKLRTSENIITTGRPDAGPMNNPNPIKGGRSAPMAVATEAVSDGLFKMAAGFLTVGTAIGLLESAFGRASEAFNTYSQSVPDLLNLSARGITAIKGGPGMGAANELGFGQQDVFRTQGEAGSAFGRGRNAQGEQNRVINLLTAARGLGVEPGQLTNAGNQLRQVGGTEMANKQMGIIIEKAFTAGLDKTQVPHYLEAATSLLANLNQTGLANSSKLLDVMTDLTAKGNMSPEQASRNIQSINSAVAHSQGEQNAFFQAAAMRAGLGGGTLLGTQFAVRQGLQGVDINALRKQVGGSKEGMQGLQAIEQMGLNKSSFTQDFAKSILGEYHRRIATGTPQGAAAGLGFIGQNFGVQTAGEATRVLAILDKISTGTATAKDTKKLSDLQKDPETKWRDDVLGRLDKVALSTAQTAARSQAAKFEFGEAAAGLFNALTNALTKLDQTLTTFFTQGPLKGAENLAAAIPGAKEAAAGISSLANPLIDAVMPAVGPAIESVSNLLSGNPATAGATKSVSDFLNPVTAKPAAAAATMGAASQQKSMDSNHMEHMVNEQRKTNQILERSLGRPGAPKVSRDTLK
jgi:hypothetical protein